jgi:hypothetical protein
MASEQDLDGSRFASIFLSYLPRKINCPQTRREARVDRLETTDIFRGAYFLCQGGDLCAIRLQDRARRIAVFVFQGEGLERLDREYRSGQALVNPLQFRESLNHLRDLLFGELGRHERGARDDSRGAYRGHQGRR